MTGKYLLLILLGFTSVFFFLRCYLETLDNDYLLSLVSSKHPVKCLDHRITNLTVFNSVLESKSYKN